MDCLTRGQNTRTSIPWFRSGWTCWRTRKREAGASAEVVSAQTFMLCPPHGRQVPFDLDALERLADARAVVPDPQRHAPQALLERRVGVNAEDPMCLLVRRVGVLDLVAGR